MPCRLDDDVKTFLGLDDKSVVGVELLPIIGVQSVIKDLMPCRLGVCSGERLIAAPEVEDEVVLVGDLSPRRSPVYDRKRVQRGIDWS